MYANLKYFCVTPSLSESHVWNHRNYGSGVQLDFVTSFCREYGATPGCAADAVGQKRNQNCRTGAAREGGEYAVGRKFSAFSGHFFGTKHRRELCFTYWRISAVFWKAGKLSCEFHLLCALEYLHLLNALGWHLHWKANALVMCTWIEASPHRHDIGIEG